MSRREVQRRNSLAKLGAVSLVAALLILGAYYLATKIFFHEGRYRVGVHFPTVAGLDSGAQVYLSGVDVGTVEEVNLQPDNTVDVVFSVQPDVDIPVGSTFTISPTLTSGPTLVIVPPAVVRGNLPRTILPLAEQPRGGNQASFDQLLQQSQDVTRRLPVMLAMLRARQGALLHSLRSTQANGLAIRAQMGGMGSSLREELAAIEQRTKYYSGPMMTTLNASRLRNRSALQTLAYSLHAMAADLNRSMDAMRTIAADPDLRANARIATQNVRVTSDNLSKIAAELDSVAETSQTKAQLRDAALQLRAAEQKASSLLGTLIP